MNQLKEIVNYQLQILLNHKLSILIKVIGAISFKNTDQMEISCNSHTHVITINPVLTFISLQPACSAFSSDIKL